MGRKPNLSRKAKDKALKNLSEAPRTGTKRRSTSQGGRETTPANEGPEGRHAQLTKTPSHKRMLAHSSMTTSERDVLARDMEIQIAAEARGVTRKDIPCDTFRSIYLCNFKKAKALPNLTIKSVGKIGKGGWGEKEFGTRLCNVLSKKVRCLGRVS